MHDETVVMLSHKKPDSVINVKVEFGEGEGKVPLDIREQRKALISLDLRITMQQATGGSTAYCIERAGRS